MMTFYSKTSRDEYIVNFDYTNTQVLKLRLLKKSQVFQKYQKFGDADISDIFSSSSCT